MQSKESVRKGRVSFFGYIQELKDEIKKINWTTQEDLKFATKMVVLSTIVFGLGIYLTDFFVKGSLDAVKNILHRVFG
jgi:preprotein translocase subunit SecE